MGNILTHDRIKLSSGILGKPGILYGGHALQSITIGRHTPKDPQQAVGYLGIVDYTSGVITSDLTLDCILVEGGSKADQSANRNTSIYRYAAVGVTIGTEQYVMTSAALAFMAGQPATVNFGYLTPTLASELDIQDQPVPQDGEESAFAVVMGDDGSGIKLVTEWYTAAPAAGVVSILDATGALTTLDDSSLPAGVQALHMSATINHDNILDVRSAHPQQFITTYPIDMNADMEVYCLPSNDAKPGDNGFNPETFRHAFGDLKSIAVVATALGKHPTNAGAGHASTDDWYSKVIGLTKVDESEAIAVGRHLTWTVNFHAADLLLPVEAP